MDTKPDFSAAVATAWAAFEAGEHLQAETAFRHLLTSPGLSRAESQQARFGLGYALAFQDRFTEARALFAALRQEALDDRDPWAEHRALHQVGMTYRLAGEWRGALATFSEERRLIAALGDDDLAVAVNAYELGTVLAQLGRCSAAKTWLDLSLARARRTTDLVAVGCAQRALGDWHAAQGQEQEARPCWEAAREAFQAAGNGPALADIQRRLTP